MAVWSRPVVHVVDDRRALVPGGAVDPFTHGQPTALSDAAARRIRVRWQLDGHGRSATFELEEWRLAMRLARALHRAVDEEPDSDAKGWPVTGPQGQRAEDDPGGTVEWLVREMTARQPPGSPTKTLTDRLLPWRFLSEHAVYGPDDIGPTGASLRLSDLTSDRARELVQLRAQTNLRRPGTPVASSTVAKFVLYCRQLFTRAMNETPPLASANPFRSVRHPGEEVNKANGVSPASTVEVVLSLEDCWKVAELLPLEQRVLVMLRAYSGARPSEVLGLWEDDLDVDGRLVRFRRSFVRVASRDSQHGRTWENNALKGRRRGVERVAPLPDDSRLLDDLAQLLAEAPERRARWARRLDRARPTSPKAEERIEHGRTLLACGDWVMLGPRGALLDLGNFGTRAWHPALKSAFPDPADPRRSLTFYEVRHSAITGLRERGAADADIAAVVGTSASNIQNIYGRVTDDQVERVRDALNGGIA